MVSIDHLYCETIRASQCSSTRNDLQVVKDLGRRSNEYDSSFFFKF